MFGTFLPKLITCAGCDCGSIRAADAPVALAWSLLFQALKLDVFEELAIDEEEVLALNEALPLLPLCAMARVKLLDRVSLTADNLYKVY